MIYSNIILKRFFSRPRSYLLYCFSFLFLTFIFINLYFQFNQLVDSGQVFKESTMTLVLSYFNGINLFFLFISTFLMHYLSNSESASFYNFLTIKGIKESSQIFQKFLSLVVISSSIFIPTIPILYFVSSVGNKETLFFFISLFVIFFLVSFYAALALVFFSIFKKSLISFVLTLLSGILLIYLPDIFLGIKNYHFFEFFRFFSPVYHMELFLTGRLHLSSIVYFISSVWVFLGLASEYFKRKKS